MSVYKEYDKYLRVFDDIASEFGFDFSMIRFFEEDSCCELGLKNAEFRRKDGEIWVYPNILNHEHPEDKIQYVMAHELHHWRQEVLSDDYYMGWWNTFTIQEQVQFMLDSVILSSHMYRSWSIVLGKGNEFKVIHPFAIRETFAEVAGYIHSMYIPTMNRFSNLTGSLNSLYGKELAVITSIKDFQEDINEASGS